MLPAFLLNIEDRFQQTVARAFIGLGRPVLAAPLPGIVLGGAAQIQGRVLVRRAVTRVERTQSGTLQLLRANLSPFFTAEVPYASVRVQLGDRTQDVVTDREGYFVARIDASGLPAGCHTVTATALDPAGPTLDTTVNITDPDVDFVIVSDIDDTIVDSGVAHGPLTMAKTVLLNDSAARVPLEGTPALYRTLAQTPDGMLDRAVVYLSTSPWNLAGFLMSFLDRNQFPSGPLLLTDWGLGAHGRLRAGSREHKLEALRGLANGLPNQRFVLLGDSGQADPEIYATFATEHPGRVAAVYIRRAGEPTGAREQQLDRAATALETAGVPFLVASDSATMLDHARAQGLVATE